MRLLLADGPATGAPPAGAELADSDLATLYAVPPGSASWLRANFATSLDGGITGSDGRSATVNSAADHVIFELVRALSDVVVIGAGTARGEGYGPLRVAPRWRPARADRGLSAELPLVVVSTRGEVPPTLRGAPAGRVFLATHEGAGSLDMARTDLGGDGVLLCGTARVEPQLLLAQLAERGWSHVLTEGGPHLLATFLGAGVVDELNLSFTPRVVGGSGPRMTARLPDGDHAFSPRVLIEEDGTVMGRWVRG